MIFADTNYIVALLNPRDQWHRTARSVSEQLDEPVVTTEWVLAELGNALHYGPARKAFLQFIDAVTGQDNWEVVPAGSRGFRAGVELFRERPDKEWSLTDCISMTVMRERGIHDALTHDHHFEQAGFGVLLKD